MCRGLSQPPCCGASLHVVVHVHCASSQVAREWRALKCLYCGKTILGNGASSVTVVCIAKGGYEPSMRGSCESTTNTRFRHRVPGFRIHLLNVKLLARVVITFDYQRPNSTDQKTSIRTRPQRARIVLTNRKLSSATDARIIRAF